MVDKNTGLNKSCNNLQLFLILLLTNMITFDIINLRKDMVNMKINKDVYKELRDLRIKSGRTRSIACDEKVKFNKSFELRGKQDDMYKKFQFYKNFINYASKKEGM